MPKQTRLPKQAVKVFKDLLENKDYPSYHTVARVVLEALIFDDGKLIADTFYSQKAGKQGTFTAVRSRLIKDGYIRVLEHSGRIIAKKKLDTALSAARTNVSANINFVTGYVNSKVENINSRIDDLDNNKADRAELEFKLEETNRRIEAIAVAVKDLQVAMEPPDSPQKSSVREKAARRIAALAQIN